MSATCAVSVTELVRRFDRRTVLDGVNLEVSAGEFVALLGRSGSGKSTLLRALAGLDLAADGSGEVRVPEKLSIVFQDARLLPWRRVLQNIEFGLSGADAHRRAIDALAEVNLSGRERAWPGDLSGGEQQRAALARSLVRDPELLLADEPFSALDALTRTHMHTLLRRLCARHRPAVLLVTHDVDEAIALADRVIVLRAGRICRTLAVERPADPRERKDYGAGVRASLLSELGPG
jgi:sulfonate transport system ATP-binding protein